MITLIRRTNRYLLALALVFAGTLGHGATALAGRPIPDLVIPSKGPVEAKVSLGKPEATAYLTVLNAGGKAARVHVSFQAGASDEIKAKVPPLTVIQSRHAARLEVTFTGLKNLTKVASGELIVEGGPKPVAQSATVTAEVQPALDWPPWIVGGSLGVAALLMGGVAVRVARKKGADGKSLLVGPAPGPKWSFEGLASKLTAVGALLGTVLSAATLPSTPVQISKESLVALSLLFAGLTAAGPFVFEAIRRPGGQSTVADALEADKAKVDALLPNWGSTRGLLIACWLILSAVLGELTTLGLAVWVITGENVGSAFIEAGLGLLVLLATYYVVVTAWALTSVDWQGLKKNVDEKTKTDAKIAVNIRARPGSKVVGEDGETESITGDIEQSEYETNRHKAREQVDLLGGRRATRHVDFGPDVTAPRLSLRLP